ncbi:hypothetical protein ACR594_004827, partial [Escherichia coli]
KTHPLLLFQGDINIRKNKFFYLYKKKENDKTEQHNTLNPSQSIKQQKRRIEKQITAQNTSEWLLFRINIFFY